MNLPSARSRLAELLARRGTTTVGLRTRTHVVLAADKRATAGYYVAHKRTRKVVRITDYMAMTTAGLVADAQMLAEYLRVEAQYYEMQTGQRMPVKAAATLLSNILFSARLFPYIVQLLLGGYDTEPRLYSLDWYGTITEEKYVATGSGSPTAIGVLEDGYREDLSVDEAVDLAKKAVMSSIRRDAFTGNGVLIAIIGRDGYREIDINL